MALVYTGVVLVSLIIGAYCCYRVALFIETVETRLRSIDRNIEKLTRGE